MTKQEAYERLELPEGADLQTVRKRFADVHNDYRMRIDNAPTPRLKETFEKNLELFKEAYTLLNESTGIDDTASLPHTGQSVVSEETFLHKSDNFDLQQALAILGVKLSDNREFIRNAYWEYVTKREAQLKEADLEVVRQAYKMELQKAERAWSVISAWLLDRDEPANNIPTGVNEVAQNEQPLVIDNKEEKYRDHTGVVPDKPTTKPKKTIWLAAILLVLVIGAAGFWWINKGSEENIKESATEAPVDGLLNNEEKLTEEVDNTLVVSDPIEEKKEEIKPEKQPSVKEEITLVAPVKEKPGKSAEEIYKEGLALYNNMEYLEALPYFTKAANLGNANATNYLGYMYQYGYGVTKNYAEAVKWFRKGAEMSNSIAQTNLGYMYENGNGLSKDLEQAVKWYREAAEQGYDVAQSNLGIMYRLGNGVTQNYTEALKWFRKAADQGNINGQTDLGYVYQYGLGTGINYTEALKWYRKAADQGGMIAQTNLGFMYEKGQGVTQSMDDAIYWYKKAAAQGEPTAKNNLNILKVPGY